MADDVGKLTFRVEVDTKKAEKGMGDLNDSMKESQKVAKETEKEIDNSASKINLKAVAIATAVGTAVVKMAKEVAKATNEIQEGRQTIVNATGATGDALEGLMSTAKAVYASTEENFDDISRAIGEINTRLGYTGEVLEDTTKIFLDFADATGQDVQQSVIDVTQAMNRWDLEAEQLPLLLDKLTVAGQASGISVANLTTSLTQNAGTLKAMGYSMDEAIAMMMTFEKQGIDANSVLMGMKKSFEDSAKAGTDARADWEDLLKSISDATDETEANSIAIEAFGNRIATDMVTALKDGSLNFDEFADAIANAEGALESTDEAGKTTGERIQTLKNQVKVSLSELGESFAPIIEDTLPALVELINLCTIAIKGVTDALAFYKKSIDEAREAGIEWVSYGDDEFATNMAMYESTLKNAEAKGVLAKATLTAEEKEKAFYDASSDSIRAEKESIRVKKEKKKATEESTEATENETEATENNAEAHKKTAKEAREELEAKQKAEALEQERIKTTETLNSLLLEQNIQTRKQSADELELAGNIEQAYAIRARLLDEEMARELSALEKKVRANEATEADITKLRQIYANKQIQLNSEKTKAIIKQEEDAKNKANADAKKISDEAKKQAEEASRAVKQKIFDIANTVSSLASQLAGIFSSIANEYQSQLTLMEQARQKDIANYQASSDKRLSILEEEHEAGRISDDEYAKDKKQIEEELANAVKERTDKDKDAESDLRRSINEMNEKAFKANKATAIATAVINGANAVLKGFAELGPILGAINAGVQAGITAAQVAIISNQTYVPSYAIGEDYIPDDQYAYVHKGEMILRKADAERLRSYGGMYGIEQIASQPLGMDMQSLSPLNINNQLSAVIEVDGTQLGIAVLKNIDNASQFVLR